MMTQLVIGLCAFAMLIGYALGFDHGKVYRRKQTMKAFDETLKNGASPDDLKFWEHRNLFMKDLKRRNPNDKLLAEMRKRWPEVIL